MALLRDLLDELDDRTGFPRGPLIVRLGILGEPVEFERAVPDGIDHDATAAWALAVVLAAPEGAEEVVDGRQEASGRAQRVLETVVRRARSGYLISCIR